jgi:hypothetical protein
VVSLREAAARLGKDPRTLKRAITAGEIRGGAVPRPERLRWYVYASELAAEEPQPHPAPPPAAELEDLRAQVVSLTETNQLLIAAQQDLLDADRSYREAADKYRSASQKYLDALTQFMTPGHLGDLADL